MEGGGGGGAGKPRTYERSSALCIERRSRAGIVRVSRVDLLYCGIAAILHAIAAIAQL